MIEAFSFGSMTIEGRRYGSDLMIFPDGHVRDAWRRAQGHVLSTKDISALIASGPEIIVAGTGVNGRMKPEDGLELQLARKNIRFLAASNAEAVQRFNEACRHYRVGACFHLTC